MVQLTHLNLPGQVESQIALKSDAHHIIHNVECCKEKQHVIIGPLPNSINLQEDGLEKEKEESDPDHLSGNHQEEIGPIRHLPHQPNLDQKTKQFEISTESTHQASVTDPERIFRHGFRFAEHTDCTDIVESTKTPHSGVPNGFTLGRMGKPVMEKIGAYFLLGRASHLF
jgi:CO dehydrogenase/acetyl-CoA synthase beta subunit